MSSPHDTEIFYWPASRLTAALHHREISSTELLNLFLERVEKVNPAVNGIVMLDPESARAQAAAADAAIARGCSLGLLHGLPMTVKDTFETAGMKTAAGSEDLVNHLPARDAVAVARVRAAGAIVFGKTNVPTLARDLQTYNPPFGVTTNPWCHARTPGGSSGGSAATLASGLTGLELGSDLAGSLRLPAHYCGVFGLRPSYGLVPTRGHIPRAPGWLTSSDMVVAGPLGRSAEDLDLGLEVLSGPGREQAVAWHLQLPPPRVAEPEDFRIGVWLDDPYCPVAASVGDVLANAITTLQAARANLDDRTRPVDFAVSSQLFEQMLHGTTSVGWTDEAFALACDSIAHRPADDESSQTQFLRNSTQRLRDWHLADEQRARLRIQWEEYFEHHDVLLCPVAPTAAIPHDHNPDFGARRLIVNGQDRPYWDQSSWTNLASLAFLPSAVVPAGCTPNGLPVGIQVVGPYLHDRTVTAMARYLSRLLGGFQPPPEL